MAKREDPSRGGVASIENVMRAFLRDSGLGGKMRRAHVFRAWRDAAGPALSRHAQPVRFRDGELVVEVRSQAHLQELSSFTGESFRREANRRLGSERIRRVHFQLQRS